MPVLLVVALCVFAALVWLGRRSRHGKADWRVSAGLIGVASLAAAAFAVVRGEWPLAVLFLIAAGWFGIDVRRRGVRSRPVGPPPDQQSMTEAHARRVLGVGPNADRAAIQKAYLARIREVHPDAGGAAGQAAELNEARDRLLTRKR